MDRFLLAIVCLYLSASTQGFTSSQVSRPRSNSCVTRSFQQEGAEASDTFDPTKIQNSTDLPDDVPKGVSTEQIEATVNKAQTLYELLGAPPTATRVELKKCYVELAKLSHPDAQIANSAYSSSNGNNNNDDDIPDFGEIAAAWRVLGDSKTRKRYDRDLRAKEFSEYAQRFANERLERAVPAVAAMMDKVAVPFLRRTTATTWAVGQAVAKGVTQMSQKPMNGNNSEKDQNKSIAIADALLNAIQAGQQAGRVIDTIELNEKSLELQERANKEQERAQVIEAELNKVIEKRLFGTLQSSNFALSSDEAKQVLDRLDIDDTVTIVNRAMLKNTIEKEIQSMEDAEMRFSEKLQQYEETDREWSDLLNRQEGAKDSLGGRKVAEIEARKVLQRAQLLVAEAKAHLVMTSTALRGVEQQVRKNAFEMDRVTSTLSKRQEKVRSVLKKKADLMNGGIQVEYLTEGDLTNLRRQEIQLMGESKQVTRMVTRLQSRAEKLQTRAEALDKFQKSGQLDVSRQVNGA